MKKTKVIILSSLFALTFGGILTSSKLINYRIEQLEKKVDKHNNFAQRIPVIEEQIKDTNHRLDGLERGV